ncbi:serine-rich adhesin for platelets-like [Watersipora subatra]|uniref:serine-rich adhesin for platelets-like n=1 Tax=Watersipora subatra TaxID=2589382 RepID=UPI00355C1025
MRASILWKPAKILRISERRLLVADYRSIKLLDLSAQTYTTLRPSFSPTSITILKSCQGLVVGEKTGKLTYLKFSGNITEPALNTVFPITTKRPSWSITQYLKNWLRSWSLEPKSSTDQQAANLTLATPSTLLALTSESIQQSTGITSKTKSHATVTKIYSRTILPILSPPKQNTSLSARSRQFATKAYFYFTTASFSTSTIQNHETLSWDARNDEVTFSSEPSQQLSSVKADFSYSTTPKNEIINWNASSIRVNALSEPSQPPPNMTTTPENELFRWNTISGHVTASQNTVNWNTSSIRVNALSETRQQLPIMTTTPENELSTWNTISGHFTASQNTVNWNTSSIRVNALSETRQQLPIMTTTPENKLSTWNTISGQITASQNTVNWNTSSIRVNALSETRHQLPIMTTTPENELSTWNTISGQNTASPNTINWNISSIRVNASSEPSQQPPNMTTTPENELSNWNTISGHFTSSPNTDHELAAVDKSAVNKGGPFTLTIKAAQIHNNLTTSDALNIPTSANPTAATVRMIQSKSKASLLTTENFTSSSTFSYKTSHTFYSNQTTKLTILAQKSTISNVKPIESHNTSDSSPLIGLTTTHQMSKEIHASSDVSKAMFLMAERKYPASTATLFQVITRRLNESEDHVSASSDLNNVTASTPISAKGLQNFGKVSGFVFNGFTTTSQILTKLTKQNKAITSKPSNRITSSITTDEPNTAELINLTSGFYTEATTDSKSDARSNSSEDLFLKYYTESSQNATKPRTTLQNKLKEAATFSLYEKNWKSTNTPVFERVNLTQPEKNTSHPIGEKPSMYSQAHYEVLSHTSISQPTKSYSQSKLTHPAGTFKDLQSTVTKDLPYVNNVSTEVNTKSQSIDKPVSVSTDSEVWHDNISTMSSISLKNTVHSTDSKANISFTTSTFNGSSTSSLMSATTILTSLITNERKPKTKEYTKAEYLAPTTLPMRTSNFYFSLKNSALDESSVKLPESSTHNVAFQTSSAVTERLLSSTISRSSPSVTVTTESSIAPSRNTAQADKPDAPTKRGITPTFPSTTTTNQLIVVMNSDNSNLNVTTLASVAVVVLGLIIITVLVLVVFVCKRNPGQRCWHTPSQDDLSIEARTSNTRPRKNTARSVTSERAEENIYAEIDYSTVTSPLAEEPYSIPIPRGSPPEPPARPPSLGLQQAFPHLVKAQEQQQHVNLEEHRTLESAAIAATNLCYSVRNSPSTEAGLPD